MSFVSLDAAQLERVLGGQNTEQWKTPRGERSSTKTDYAVCTDAVRNACDRQNSHWFWGTDNAKSGACVNENLAKNCGLPPSQQQGQ
jgi:hypothetical protein